MTQFDRRFDFNYSYNPSYFGKKQHTYEVVGRDGAIHFHVTESKQSREGGGPEFYGGLEIHYRVAPAYMNRPPSHHNCRLLGGPCWHDGTSLYASEVLIPRWQLDFPNHDEVFRWLTHEFDSRFTPEEGAET